MLILTIGAELVTRNIITIDCYENITFCIDGGGAAGGEGGDEGEEDGGEAAQGRPAADARPGEGDQEAAE